MTYELIIYSRTKRVNFRALFYKEKDRYYFRVKYDRFNFTKMIEQFLSKGSIKVYKQNKDYEIEHHTFEDIDEICSYLQEEGFSVSLKEIPQDFVSMSIIVDGQDLNPEVISIGESERVLQFSNALYQYINNVDYSPKFKERASSYAIDIQESDMNKERVFELLESIKKGEIDIETYFSNERFRTLIKRLKELVAIKTLESFAIEIDKKRFDLPIKDVKKYLRNIEENIKKRKFTKRFTPDKLRAFDDKKMRVVLDLDRKYSLHFKQREDYEQLKKIKTGVIVPQRSFYISTQTILIGGIAVEENG